MSTLIKHQGTAAVRPQESRPEAEVSYGTTLTATEWKHLPGVSVGTEPLLSLADEPITRGGNGRFYQAQEGWRLDSGLLTWAVCRRPLRQIDGRRFAPAGPWEPELTRYELAELRRRDFRPTACTSTSAPVSYDEITEIADVLPGPARVAWDSAGPIIERELLVPMLYGGNREVIAGARVAGEAVTVVRCERCPRSGPWTVTVWEASLERHLRALRAQQAGAFEGLSAGSVG